jgi:hypothetical protein
MDGHDVKRVAHQASRSPALDAGARAGYAVSGLLHVLIGWITAQVALGNSAKDADQSGALAALAGNSLGRLLLWVAVVGFVGLALWQLVDAVVGHPGGDARAWGDRGKALAKAILYLALAWSAFSFARGASKSSSKQTVDFTSTLLDKPGGRFLVVLVGLVVVAVGAYHVHKGWRKKFLEDLEDHPGRWPTRAGQLGYVAKGVALAIVGFLFGAAGIHGNAQEATGLDGALKSLRDEPLGTVLLLVMALGFAAYGLYSFSRSRHAKV